MKTKIITITILTIFIIVSLCGCSGEAERSSSQSSGQPSNSSNETSSPVSLGLSGSTGPEYLYEEFINDEEPDTSMLGKEEGTREEAEQLSADIKMIEDRLTGLDQTYKEDGKIELEQVDSYLAEVAVVLENLYENNEIADFDYGAGCLEVTLNSGVAYIISPEVKDCDAGGSGTKIKIATYQPFRTASIEEKYPVERLDRLDEGARLISDSVEQYEFFQDGSSTDYDLEDEEVTLESVLKFQNYNVVLWHGHGDYTKSKGSLLLLGVKCSEENNIKYMKDLREGRLVCDGGYYAVTSTFIDTYIPDGALKNHIIYLGTCHSGEDERLAQSFLNKGAMAVYANSGIIYRDYNLSMIYSVAEGLTRQADDGSYYTTEMALDYAREINGEYDGNGTETKLFVDPDAEAVSLDWYQDYVRAERDVVVVLDESGSMQGEPLDETKEAASKFVDTVLEKNSRVAMIPYSSSADLQNDFSRRKTVLKTNIGDLQAFGQTNTYSAVEMADQTLDASPAKTKIMLVMTDGMPNLGTALNGSYEDALVQYCKQMKQKGYYIYTLGFFSHLNETEKSIPQNMLQDMASPGCHYEVKDAGDLVYKCAVTVKDKRDKGGLNMATPRPHGPAVIQDNPTATAGQPTSRPDQPSAGSPDRTPAPFDPMPEPTPDNSGSEITYPSDTEYAALMDCHISYIDRKGWFEISDADGEVIRGFYWPYNNKDIVYDGILTGGGEVPFNSSNKFYSYAASGENMNHSDIRIGDSVDVVYGYYDKVVDMPLEKRPCFCAAINVHDRQGLQLPDNFSDERCYPTVMEYAAYMDCRISDIDGGMIELSDTDGKVVCRFGEFGPGIAMPKYFLGGVDVVYDGILTDLGGEPFNSSNKLGTYEAKGENMDYSDIRIGDIVDVVYGYSLDVPNIYKCLAINVHKR